MRIVNDPSTVDALLELYQPRMKRMCRHDITGARTKLPSDRDALIKLLNYTILDPEVALVWGDDLPISQLAIWRPYIKNSRRRFSVFSKSNTKRDRISEEELGTKILVGTDGVPMEKFLGLAPSLTTLLYITEKGANYSYIKNWPSKIHVFANHGDSDKHSNASRMATAYDFVMVSDHFSADRFMRNGIQLDISRFLLIGGSVIEGVEVKREPPVTASRVLYAPTWEGHSDSVNFSSLLKCKNRIEEFIGQGGALRFRPHPGTGSENKEFAEARKSLNAAAKGAGKTSKVDDFNWSDVALTDLSGVVTEYLYSCKPIIIACGKSEKWLKSYLNNTSVREFAYIWDYESSTLQSALDNIQQDKLNAARVKRRESKFFGGTSIQESAAIFDQALDLTEATFRNRMRHRGRNVEQAPELESLELRALVQEIRSGAVQLYG